MARNNSDPLFRRGLLVVLILGLVIGLSFFMQRKAGVPEPGANSQSEQPDLSRAHGLTQPIAATTSALPSPTSMPSNSQASTSGSGKLEFPSLKAVREQVAQDPHGTPPALLQFARDLSARAEAAKGSPETAKAFFETLEECLDNEKGQEDSVPVAAQTLCLTEAEEFAKLYPDALGPRLEPLEKNASPELKRIRKALSQF
jgi:hypothetical protein